MLLFRARQKYVVGLLFNDDASSVTLISKLRPPWQVGMLNGAGGHVEKGETPLEAMTREGVEELGVQPYWRYFCELSGLTVRNTKRPNDRWTCYFFLARSTAAMEQVRTMTDEVPVVVEVAKLSEAPVLPNIRWLVPMALSFSRGEICSSFELAEVY